MDNTEITDIVNPQAEGFKEKVTPKTPEKLFLFECPGCGGKHFRHAGLHRNHAAVYAT